MRSTYQSLRHTGINRDVGPSGAGHSWNQLHRNKFRCCISLVTFLVCLLTLSFSSLAQPRDTLTTEQLLQRRGGSYAALLRPSRYLALDVNGALGTFRRYRFFVGDELAFRVGGERYREQLYDVSDSTFTILLANESMNRDEPVTFRVADVEKVFVHRRIPFVTIAGPILPLAGGVYLLASVVNRNYSGKDILPVSGGLALAGAIFSRMSNPRYRISKNHRLRVLQTY